MSDNTPEESVESAIHALKELRLNQARELMVLLHDHRRQESRLIQRLESAQFRETYHDAMESDSVSYSSVEDITPPTAVATPDTVIPVATRIPNTHRAYDVNDFELEIGDNVEVLTAGRNNEAGDSAKVIEIHDTKQNWIRISIYGTEVETYRIGTNLQKIHHYPSD